jgi:tetratricopeptide (TPR) repeat protein
LSSTTAAAQAPGPASDPVAAEALFDQARQLMEQGKYAEACPKLEASQRLDPGVGTLLNLGDCLERVGRTASAWERFREAAAAAVAGAQAEREAIARGRAAAIEPRLCRLAVRVEGAADVPGLALERDHVPFDRALWNEALPVDPGEHDVRATAPGKEPWSGSAHLESGACAGGTETIHVPVLQEAHPPPLAWGAAPVPTRMTRWGLQRELALVAVGAGVLLLGTSGALAIDASVSYSNAKDQCLAHGCPSSAQQSGASAGNVADFATAALVAGGAAAVLGGILWFTAPKHPLAITPMATFTGAGLTLRGELL